MPPRHQAEYARGREAASAALATLGEETAAIVIGPRGAPVWPDGFTGSISHTADLAVAVAVRTSDRASIGIDVERGDRSLDVRTLRRFCTPLELSLLSQRDDGWLTPIALFCAKEATYKALARWLPSQIGWRDADFRPDGEDTLTGTLSARAAGFAPARTVVAHVLAAAGFVVVCVEIPAMG